MKARTLLVLEILVLAAVYYLCGRFGLSLAFLHKSASAVWPPTGLALAALLLRGTRLWPGVFIGAFCVNYHVQASVPTSLAIASGNTLEAILGMWLVTRFAGGLRALETTRNLFRFVLLAAMLSTLVSPTLGVTSLCLGHLAEWNNYLAIWLVWWLGDMVSNFIIAPLLIIWLGAAWPRPKLRELFEAAGLLAMLVVVGAIVFLGRQPFGDKGYPLEYLAIPPLLWAAFRFGQRGASSFAFVMSAIALWGTRHGFGPFSQADPNESLLLLQAFMGTITITALALASIISERQRAEERLQMQDAMSRILAEALTLREATPRIFQALYDESGWEIGAIWHVDSATNELACVEVWHIPSLQIPEFEAVTRRTRFARGVGLPGRVWSSGKPVGISDVTKDANFPRAPAAIKEGLHGALCFPIKLGEQILGIIECFSREVREPDEHFLQMLGAVGNQLGQFIERKSAEEMFRQLADAMPQIVWAARPDGSIDYYNQRWYEFIGLNEAGAEEGWKKIVHPDDLERSLATYFECIRAERPYEIEYRFKDRSTGGYRWFLGRALPVRDEAGKVIRWFGTCTDIDEQKQTEHALAEAQDVMRQHADHLEKRVQERTAKLQETIRSLDSFCYSIAHDLRAPLRALGGFSNELANEYVDKLDDLGRDYVRRIKEAAARMDQLILDLLELGRLNTLELTTDTVQLEPLIQRALAPLETAIKSRGARVQIAERLLPVRGSAVIIEQVLANLLGNALKFVPPGIPPQLEIWTESSEQMVRLCVRDNGIGMKADHVKKIFQPFVRLVNGIDYPGTGIGLAIVRRGAERMGGRVGVTSELGKGSCFWIDLPSA